MSAKPTRKGPPPPVPKRGHVKVVRAIYNYNARRDDELTFEEGDVIYITEQSDSNWWKGKCGTKVGLIPSNYVEENTQSVDFPLHEAARRGNLNFLTECITNGVSVNSLDKAGSTPLHWAAHGGHTDCMEALFHVSNIEINVQNKIGDTPLHSAAWKKHASAVQMLLDKGALVNLRNNENLLAFDLAKDPKVAALLQCSDNLQNGDDYLDDSDGPESD
ncbi:osteoclast-stimulating factor 1-like [Argonauta hians]